MPPTRAALAATALIVLMATACADAPTRTATGVRILVEFTTPTDGAAPATRAFLEATGGVSVHYVTAVSGRTHAYRLACPPQDDTCSAALDALRRAPAIRSVTPDHLKDTP